MTVGQEWNNLPVKFNAQRGDKKRHKYVSEWQKPIPEQRGAVRCTTSKKWFR